MAFKNKKDKANEFDLNGNETEIFLDETVDSAINSTSNTKKTKKDKKATKNAQVTTTTTVRPTKRNDNEYSKAQLCEMYHPKCTQSRYWQITVISTILMAAVGIGYQLSFPFILIVAATGFFLTQNAILAFCRNKYENQKI